MTKKIKTLFIEKKGSLAASAAFIGVFCVLPLFLPDKYVSVMRPKLNCFGISVLTAFLISCIYDLIVSKNKEQHFNLIQKNNRDKLFLALFVTVCGISVIFSDFKKAAFTGTDSRYMGFLTMVLILIAYFLFSSYLRLSTFLLRAAETAFILCVLWGYIQFLGIDIFSLFYRYSYSVKRDFLSPLGNINVFSSYICLLAPAFMFGYCNLKSGFYEYISCIFAFVGAFISNSDSCFLGIGVAFILVLYFGFKDSEALIKAIKLVLTFFITGLCVSFFYRVAGEAARPMSQLSTFISSGYISLIGIVVGFIILTLIKKFFYDSNRLALLKKGYIVFLAAGFVSVIALIIYYTFIDKSKIGMLSRFFCIDDNWGTGRVFIWKLALREFASAPIQQKLFGIGGDCLGKALIKHRYQEMYSFGNCIYDNAHNEFIQYFVTFGIFGLCFYLLFLVFSLKKAYEISKKSMLNRALFIGAVCYLVHSFVTITQPVTTPMFFAFLACACSGEGLISVKRPIDEVSTLQYNCLYIYKR